MITIDREELAWAAGFFDGEGCFFYSPPNAKRHRGPIVGLNVTQKGDKLLERFSKSVGGLGHITKRKDRSGMWALTVNRWQEVQAIAAMLWCFLGEPKKKQCSLAFQRYRSHSEWGRPIGNPNWLAGGVWIKKGVRVCK